MVKEALKDAFNVVLYNGDKKDIEINGSGKIYDKMDENKIIDVIISTSMIQSGQSLTENVLQIFIQTSIDSISSVEQFIGRNRLKNSTTHRFMRLIKDKCVIRQSINRYEYHLNHLRAIAWDDMAVSSWRKILNKLGRLIVDESIMDVYDPAKQEECQPITENNKPLNDIIINIPINKLFNVLKKLYKYYDFKSCPKGYRITMNKLTIKDKCARSYKLIKDEDTSESTNKTNDEANDETNETVDEATCRLLVENNKISESANEATCHLLVYNKQLNHLFRGKCELFKFYNITA